MRKLQTQDVFKMARIIKVADLKEKISQLFAEGKKVSKDATEEEKKEAQEAIGIEMFMSVLDACANEKLEKQVYDLLGGIFEMEPDKVKELSLDTMIDKIKQLVNENNMSVFFKAAGRLTVN